MTARDTIAAHNNPKTLDQIFSDMLEEMRRRMGNEKYIWQTAEDFSTNPEWLPVDDTQIGIEFAFEYLKPFLALTAAGFTIVPTGGVEADMERAKAFSAWWEGSGRATQYNHIAQQAAYAAWCAASPHMPVPAGWQPIETAPKNQKILVAFQNRLGNWRIVTACFHTRLPWSDDHWRDDDDENEYAPEGWYEESETQETIYLIEYAPTLWQPLPAAPLSSRPKGGA